MNTPDSTCEPECPLCGGLEQVEISPDGTYQSRESYGCPLCISRDLHEEIDKLKAQRDLLLAACKKFVAYDDTSRLSNGLVIMSVYADAISSSRQAVVEVEAKL